MTLNDIQKYYSGLLTAQYRLKPKAVATIEAMVKEFSCDDLVRIESVCFDLDSAIGAQLNVIGKIVGVPRNIYGLDLTHTFWSFRRYSSGSGGVAFLRYTDVPNPTNVFSRYLSTGTYGMTDFEMRSLIKLKILFNTAPFTMKAIKNGLYAIFQGAIDITDGKNSTITITVSNPYHNVMAVASFIGNVIPKPMGVAVTVTNI